MVRLNLLFFALAMPLRPAPSSLVFLSCCEEKAVLLNGVPDATSWFSRLDERPDPSLEIRGPLNDGEFLELGCSGEYVQRG